MKNRSVVFSGIWVLLAAALVSIMLTRGVAAQDERGDFDPPSRVARLGYLQGSISFEPAGESEWVEAVRNRPLTTGDRIWADRSSRAELDLGSAVIDLNSNTGASFLNLDDRTTQIELNGGAINVRVRYLDRDDVFEIDTPNQAFSIFQPGRYRVEASDDGTYTVVSIREGAGEATGNGQTYTLRAGQRAIFQGTNSLNASVEDVGDPDDFDNWCYERGRRYENSQSARYVSRDLVGYEDLDDNGDWRPYSSYGNVWFPRVAADWAPYREGHWAWIDPWGWTWVDDEPWGYAPFHYGRWISIDRRWGWLPGPREVRPVYAPALVVFVGGGGGGFGDNIGWFPLGPREVYVPSYRVSRGYVNRVNVSNTVVDTTTITNVYNTTVVNNTTTVERVTYVNRGVSGAVTAVPQRAFTSAQPVARVAVAVNQREITAAPLRTRAVLAPTPNSVLGEHASTVNRVATPPPAVSNRPVVAKAAAPPPPASFAAKQKALTANPGQPIARQEMQRMAPTNAAAARPQVKQAPPGKPATPGVNQTGNRPAGTTSNQPTNQPSAPPASNEHAGQTERPAPANQAKPNNGEAEPPARTDRSPAAQPNNRPEPKQQEPNNRPEPNRPQPNRPEPSDRKTEPPVRPDTAPATEPNRHPEPNQSQPNNQRDRNQPEPPARDDSRRSAQPDHRPDSNQPQSNRPESNRPQPNGPDRNKQPTEPPAGHDRPSARPPNPEPGRATDTPQRSQTPEEKRRQEEQLKKKEQRQQKEEPPQDEKPQAQ